MANYVRIENNSIIQKEDDLPENWENVSNFRHARNNDSFINRYNWYRVVKNSVDYDSRLQYISHYEYVIRDTYVEETPVLINIPQPSIDELKLEFMNSVRSKRNNLLAESDWTQMLDIQSIKSPEWIMSWKTYRQQLRDFPEVCENIMPTNDIDSLLWPTKPLV